MFPYRQKAYLTRDLVICKISFHFYFMYLLLQM